MTVRIIHADVLAGLAQIESDSVLAYCAGIIDADGSIGIRRSTYAMRVRKDATQPVYSERVCLKQVSPEAVDLLHGMFDGARYLQGPSARKGKPLYTWECTNLKAATFLQAILPHLRIKVAQAENCLKLRMVKEKSKRSRVPAGRGHAGAAKRPVSLTDTMETLYLAAKNLNSVGI